MNYDCMFHEFNHYAQTESSNNILLRAQSTICFIWQEVSLLFLVQLPPQQVHCWKIYLELQLHQYQLKCYALYCSVKTSCNAY